MKTAIRGAVIALVVTVLWVLAFYNPTQDKIEQYNEQTSEAERLYEEIVTDEATRTERLKHETGLVNTVGYTRPTSDAEQMARMVEQVETACVLAGVGLEDLAPMEAEQLSGPSLEDASGVTTSIGLVRHPLQAQTIGDLEGTVSLVHWLRQTNPMMVVDRMVITRDDDGLVRMSAVVSSWRPDVDTISGGGA